MFKRTLANFYTHVKKLKNMLQHMTRFLKRHWKIVLPVVVLIALLLPVYMLAMWPFGSDAVDGMPIVKDYGDVTPEDGSVSGEPVSPWPVAVEDGVQEVGGAATAEQSAPAEATKEQEAKPVLTEMVLPVTGQIIMGFGHTYSKVYEDFRFHGGVDMSVQRNTPVAAVLTGKVTAVEYNELYGYRVTVDHGAGWETRYSHLGKVAVVSGDTVERGTVIGQVGEPGRAEGDRGTHLHLELLKDKQLVDPLTYLPVK
ncbi:MAG: M23 family metallopeptidase [Thermoanaerobacteraceae bacterium]|nr:M23 family metallopeptidase [Thermoanaerobacteraceae bacterium]